MSLENQVEKEAEAQKEAPPPAVAPEESAGEKLLNQILYTHGSRPVQVAAGVNSLNEGQRAEVMDAVQKRFGNTFADEVSQEMRGKQEAVAAPPTEAAAPT